ncbi:MAG: aldehyde-activating protein [Alphaproteobacteria bacterium]
MTIYRGSCHCGAIEVDYETAIPAAEATMRACQCSFCRKHQSRSVSDPAGRATIRVRDAALLNRYRFGMGVTDFLVCRGCGVYVGAYFEAEGGAWATLMVNAFDGHADWTGPLARRVHDAEDASGRVRRRQDTWTPATLVVDPS